MSETEAPNDEAIKVYAMFWRLLELAVHRYGSYPTGQLLTVLTLILLDRVGHHPTVTELSRITRMAKSSVSRYVSAEMSNGFIEERIDPNDRRRRLLYPSPKALEEQRWHQRRVREIAQQTGSIISGEATEQEAARKMIEILLEIKMDGELPG